MSTLNTLKAMLGVERTNDDVATAEEFAKVRMLSFANLTAPILRQMTGPGGSWASLVDIHEMMERHKLSTSQYRWMGDYGPECEAGLVRMTVNPRGTIRTTIRIRQTADAWSAVGPNEISGRYLDVDTHLPETLLTACAGRCIDEVVDERLAGIVGRDVRIRRAEAAGWGTRFTLDLPLIQPTDDELHAIRAALTPMNR